MILIYIIYTNKYQQKFDFMVAKLSAFMVIATLVFLEDIYLWT